MITHRFSFEVVCPKCGAAGRVDVEEEGGPPFTDSPRRAYSIDPGLFDIVPGQNVTLRCKQCATALPGEY